MTFVNLENNPTRKWEYRFLGLAAMFAMGFFLAIHDAQQEWRNLDPDDMFDDDVVETVLLSKYMIKTN